MNAAERIKLAADVLFEQFGNCDDIDFEMGCACCQASYVRRMLLGEPTPDADKAFQEAMR